MAISPDSQWLATSGSDGTVRIWDAATGQARALMRVGGLIWCGDIQVGQDEAVAVNGTGAGELGDGQVPLARVQGAAPQFSFQRAGSALSAHVS